MKKTGRELRQRLQHEVPFVQTRMRYNQPFVFVNQIAVEQQIEIDGARPIAFLPHAPKLLLNGKQPLEQIVDLALGSYFDNGIEIRSLSCGSADRPGLVHG